MKLVATARPVFWAVPHSEGLLQGDTSPGNTTESALLYFSEEEAGLLAALTVADVAAPELPEEPGSELRRGTIYSYAGTLLMVRKNTVRVPGDPLIQVSEFGIYREGEEAFEWVAGEILPVGARRLDKGVLYELYRDIADANWSPPSQTLAHWKLVATTADEWPEFVQPTGAHDAYPSGAKITFNAKHYVSLIPNNVWSPVAYPAGWQLQA